MHAVWHGARALAAAAGRVLSAGPTAGRAGREGEAARTQPQPPLLGVSYASKAAAGAAATTGGWGAALSTGAAAAPTGVSI